MASTNIFNVSKKIASVLLVLLFVDLTIAASIGATTNKPHHSKNIMARLNDPCTHRTRHARNVHFRNATCYAIAVVKKAKQNLPKRRDQPVMTFEKKDFPLSGKINLNKKMNKTQPRFKNLDEWVKKAYVYEELRSYVAAIDYMVFQMDEKSERTNSLRDIGHYATAVQCEMYSEFKQHNKNLPADWKNTKAPLRLLVKVEEASIKSYWAWQDYKVLDKFNKFLNSIQVATGEQGPKCPKTTKNRKRKNKKVKKVPKVQKDKSVQKDQKKKKSPPS